MNISNRSGKDCLFTYFDLPTELNIVCPSTNINLWPCGYGEVTHHTKLYMHHSSTLVTCVGYAELGAGDVVNLAL